MKVIADLQLHSKYARAVSKNMELTNMALWAAKKGIGLIGASDWTHPLWYKEIRDKLEETSEGIYKLKKKYDLISDLHSLISPSFLLSTEISSEFYSGGRYRKIHILIFVPSFGAIEKINNEFIKRGQKANMVADGRPKIFLHSRDVAELVLNIEPNALLIPAHSWTPHYGYFGKQGGFDSLEEGFGEYAKYIYAVETGLGSDPAMNWRIADLDNRNIVSFSDAHSLPKMAREATVFEVSGHRAAISYQQIREAIVNKSTDYGLQTTAEDKARIAYTIEFYRQEGKYHFTGHRKCGVSFSPEETKKIGLICPVCGKKLTVGALQRTEDLAARNEAVEYKFDNNGVRWVYSKEQDRPPFVNLVPLQEIITEVLKVGVGSKKVQGEYERLVSTLAPEFEILLNCSLDDIEKAGGARLREALEIVRRGEVFIKPGYDGIFGKVQIWPIKDDTAKVAKGYQEGLF